MLDFCSRRKEGLQDGWNLRRETCYSLVVRLGEEVTAFYEKVDLFNWRRLRGRSGVNYLLPSSFFGDHHCYHRRTVTQSFTPSVCFLGSSAHPMRNRKMKSHQPCLNFVLLDLINLNLNFNLSKKTGNPENVQQSDDEETNSRHRWHETERERWGEKDKKKRRENQTVETRGKWVDGWEMREVIKRISSSALTSDLQLILTKASPNARRRWSVKQTFM